MFTANLHVLYRFVSGFSAWFFRAQHNKAFSLGLYGAAWRVVGRL